MKSFILLLFACWIGLIVSCNEYNPKSDAVKDVQKKADEYRKAKTDKLAAEKHQKYLEEEAKWEFFWGGPLTPIVEKKIPKVYFDKMKNRGCDMEQIQKIKYPEKWNVSWSAYPNLPAKISMNDDYVSFTVQDPLVLTSPFFAFGDDEYEIVATFQGKGIIKLGYILIEGNYNNLSVIESVDIGMIKKRFIKKIDNTKKYQKFYLYFRIAKSDEVRCFDITIRKKIKNEIPIPKDIETKQ